MAEITIGIIAGLISTFIVVIFQKLWSTVIQPWYEEQVYKDAKIEGRWIITYPEENVTEIAELNRKGHRIQGVITVTEGADKGKAYALEGTFKNLILTASYSAVNRANLDRGSYGVFLRNNGQEFSGHSVYYEDEEHIMGSNACTWTRE